MTAQDPSGPRRPATDSRPSAPRSPRRSSARTPPCPGCSSPCCAAATCCSRGCPAWPRRCWCAPWPGRSPSSTKRVQFTPDLMPGDITGSMVIDGRAGELTFREGPLFTQPAAGRRDQPDAAQDPVGTAGGDGGGPGLGRRRLAPAAAPLPGGGDPEPGRVRGHLPAPGGPARPLPAQARAPGARRGTPSWRSCAGTRRGSIPRDVAAAGVTRSRDRHDIDAGQDAVGAVQVSPEVTGYIVDIARATRESPSLSLGVSPRGATALMRRPRAWAWLTGRDFVTPDDVKALAHATLVHRLGLRPEAELEGVDVSPRCWPPRSARSRCRADRMTSSPGASPSCWSSGWCPSCCDPPWAPCGAGCCSSALVTAARLAAGVRPATLG